MPTIVVSTTLEEPLDWPDVTLDAAETPSTSSRGSRRSRTCRCARTAAWPMNRALMAAGLVDRVQVSVFPVISGRTGTDPIFGGAADFDLELVEQPDPRRAHPGALLRPSLHG